MKIYDPTIRPLGLILAGSKESIPPGALRRARGVHSILHNSIKSRWGSTLLHSVDAHSLYRYNDVRFQGVGTQLYRSGVSIDSGYDGTRLSFVKMKPSPDVEFGGTQTGRVNKLDDDVAALGDTTVPDYLFVAGGGKLRKVDSLGTVTNWGITAPPDGFTASKQSPSTNVIESFEDSTSWTIVATSATLADEASIKQEGVNALKMTVAASKVGEIYKATVLNLEKFALPAVTESSLEDYITIWVRVDNPSNVENLQLIFDLDDGSFNVNTFSITIPVQSNILPQKQLVEQTIGVGSTIAVSEFDFKIQKDTKGKKSGDYVPLTSSDFATLLSKTSQGYIILGQNLWTHLRIPKRSFNQTGPTSKDWGDIQGIKLIVKTNSRGTAIAYWDVARLEGGSGMMGTYKFRATFLNSTTGSRSNPNPSATDVVVESVTRQPIELQNLPASTDPQIDKVEIWRTVGNGASYFKAAEVANGITTYSDTASDFAGMHSVSNETVLQSIELPLDNDPPEATFDDAVGPYLGAMWWCRDSVQGAKGRVYYSPVGRPEAVLGFIYAGTDDNPTQKLIVWNEQLYVFTEARLMRIIGSQEPFQAVECFGCPGTLWPETVIATPYGIVYRATDGIRLFNGATSDLVDIESIYPILRGESSENLNAFNGIVATYARREYVISDGSQTLAHNLSNKVWRDLGIGCNALYFEDDTGNVIGSFNASTFILENENVIVGDGNVPLNFEIEFPTVMVNSGQKAILQALYIEVNTNGQSLTPTLLLDGVESTLPAVTTPSKQLVEFPINKSARLIGLRLTGSLTNRVEISSIESDIYAGQNASAAA